MYLQCFSQWYLLKYYFFHLFYLDCKSLRQPLIDLSEQQLTEWIKDKIRSAALQNNTYYFIVKGKTVCINAFCSIYGISDHKFNVALSNLETVTVHKHVGKKKKNEKQIFLQTWFNWLIVSFGDHMPNSNHIYLPTFFTKTSFILNSCGNFEMKSDYNFSEKFFVDFWKEHFPQVKVSKSFRMGVCDTCMQIQEIKLTKGSDEAKKWKYEHNKLTSSSREHCNQLRTHASQHPFQSLYIQFDGKQASYLPHLIPIPKETQNVRKVRTTVYGVKLFAGEGNTHFYVALPHWTAGANLSITILFNSIIQHFKNIKHERPPQLFIQVDNCVKDGKNKTLYAFAAHLVYWNWFKEVQFISLIQGHTHDLIDAEFSKWSLGERKRPIKSLPKLNYFLESSYKKNNCSYSVIRKLYDWISYFNNVLVDISQFTSYRLFKIFRNDSNNILMMVKKNVLDQNWSGFSLSNSSEQHEITLCTSYLQNPPPLLSPNPLPREIISPLSTSELITKYYDSEDSAFWNGLERDSLAYLQQEQLFEKEGNTFIFIHLIFFRFYDQI